MSRRLSVYVALVDGTLLIVKLVMAPVRVAFRYVVAEASTVIAPLALEITVLASGTCAAVGGACTWSALAAVVALPRAAVPRAAGVPLLARASELGVNPIAASTLAFVSVRAPALSVRLAPDGTMIPPRTDAVAPGSEYAVPGTYPSAASTLAAVRDNAPEVNVRLDAPETLTPPRVELVAAGSEYWV